MKQKFVDFVVGQTKYPKNLSSLIGDFTSSINFWIIDLEMYLVNLEIGFG